MRDFGSRLRAALARRRLPPVPPRTFAVVGAAGWIARVHLAALRAGGHRLAFAMDPSDAGIAILDEYFPDTCYLRDESEVERYFAERDRPAVSYLTVCSPDYLHKPHVELALKNGVDAICEKPLAIQPSDLDEMERWQQETGRRVYPIVQHRYNPAVLELERELARRAYGRRAEVEVTYVAHRGRWYSSSWRGREDQCAGLAMDIGIHFFDLLTHLFGGPVERVVHLKEARALGGYLELERARVRWFLSIDSSDLPAAMVDKGVRNLRSFLVDGRAVELSRGMRDLHGHAYREIVLGRGLTIDDVRPGLTLASDIQRSAVRFEPERAHELTAARVRRSHGAAG